MAEAMLEASLWAALEKADAADLIRSIDGRLDARLGKQFGGTELSGGEWQKKVAVPWESSGR